jgi:hypothetical protein
MARVTLCPDQIDLAIDISQLARALGIPAKAAVHERPMIVLSVPAALRRSGKGKRLVIGEPSHAAIEPGLVRLMQDAVAARAAVMDDTRETLNGITARLSKSKGHLTALLRLSYLAPDIVRDILAGRQPPEFSRKQLLRMTQDLPLDWSEQRTVLRFSR